MCDALVHLADNLTCGVEVTELGIEGADPDGHHAVGDVPFGNRARANGGRLSRFVVPACSIS